MNRLVIFSVTALMMLVVVSCQQRPLKPYITGMENTPMPGLNILLQDSVTYLNTQKLEPTKGVILFYYSPTCQFCRAQMREMINHMERYKDDLLLVVTNEDFKSMKSFIQYFKLDQYKNIISGIDPSNSIENSFRVVGVPFTARFSNDKKLTAAYVGRLRGKALEIALK